MATGNITETTASGVIYTLTYNASTGPLGGNTSTYTLVITDPGGATTTVTGIPYANVLAAGSTGTTLGSLLSVGTNVYVIPPTADGTVDITAGLSNNTTVYVGGTATIDQTVSLLGSTTINVDGGTATLAPGVVASALTSTTVNI